MCESIHNWDQATYVLKSKKLPNCLWERPVSFRHTEGTQRTLRHYSSTILKSVMHSTYTEHTHTLNWSQSHYIHTRSGHTQLHMHGPHHTHVRAYTCMFVHTHAHAIKHTPQYAMRISNTVDSLANGIVVGVVGPRFPYLQRQLFHVSAKGVASTKVE